MSNNEFKKNNISGLAVAAFDDGKFSSFHPLF